jgi:hypothetical protein
VLGTDTNRYIKLANLYFNRESSAFWYECGDTDMDVDTEKYCHQAENLFALYQNCYGRNPVETIVDNFIVEMDAVKISVHGKLFFVPLKKELNLLNDDFDVINLQSQELQIRLNKMGRGEAWK